MSSLSEIYIKKQTLQTMLNVLEAKNQDGISLTISISDETNQYGQNLTCFVAQSKEEREAKKDKFYIGNGKCFFTDGKITKAVKVEKQQVPEYEDYNNTKDLPF